MKRYDFQIHKIEIDLLIYLYEAIECESLLMNFLNIKEIQREFTGVGAFISFEFYDKYKLKNEKLKNLRLTGPLIKSDEFEHDALVSYSFDDYGVLDYIEFEFGMKEKKYPIAYEFKEAIINMIKA